ncbi:MAG: hypothetical protein HYS20_09165 [Rhodocyclales bacterium]|nr:hypothetical protein [Rhodocyclales bacterium]
MDSTSKTPASGNPRRVRLDYAIARFEPPGRAPYLACTIKRKKVVYYKKFALSSFASEEQALAAVQRWRDDLLARLRPMTRAEFASQIRPNNKSGVPGVRRVNLVQTRSGKRYTYACWTAETPKGMEPRQSRLFSIMRYGEKEAFARAVAAREAFLSKFQGYKLTNVPDEFTDRYQEPPRHGLDR